MLGLYRQIPRIRRQRLMDAAEAASVPYFEKTAHRQWWQQQVQAATAESAPVRQAGASSRTPFTFNGAWVGLGQLKANVGQVLGSGFSQ